ncbi:MAG: 2-isopropylmalate synthase [Clostridiales bacterium]|jgi:isopropylmalate/homocitrate/citramalate synthase|nr:2-isopropylmalate synthase [Clostridiales bacterium]
MIYFNEKRNILEEHIYAPELQDVGEPELFREIFEYDTVPKVTFNNRIAPMNPPDRIWITDSTFRDGQQAMFPFSVEQIVHIFGLLSKLGGHNGIIRQSEFFLYTEKDRLAVRKCQELGLRFPEITSWIRANEKDFELVKEMGIKETGILVSCSDYHIFKKMNLTRKQALEKYLAIIKKALDKGIVPRCHFEDITRADIYGFVIPFANELMKLSKESGIAIKIRACDTMGYGITHAGSSFPRSVQGIIYGLLHYSQVPSEQLEWHGHNDFYRAVINSTTAWLYGCASVNTTLLGIGERTGNTPLEAMAIEYAGIRGTFDGMDFPVITEIAEYFENEMGYTIPEKTPFVGRNFNMTRAGIHADGLLKDEEIYNIFNTGKILGRPPIVAIDAFSGLAGIAFWMNNFYKLEDGNKVDKKSAVISGIKQKVDEVYAAGRNTCMSDGELEIMFKESDSGLHKQFVKQLTERKKRKKL